MKVYIVIEDDHEDVILLVTADHNKAHTEARDCFGLEPRKKEREGITVYTSVLRNDYFVRVEEHEVR